MIITILVILALAGVGLYFYKKNSKFKANVDQVEQKAEDVIHKAEDDIKKKF